jgi:hypothetical protein
MRTTNSSIGRAAKSLMSEEARTKKAKPFKSGVIMEAKDKSGTSCISIKIRDHRRRV